MHDDDTNRKIWNENLGEKSRRIHQKVYIIQRADDHWKNGRSQHLMYHVEKLDKAFKEERKERYIFHIDMVFLVAFSKATTNP